jgi:hypothetical protein
MNKSEQEPGAGAHTCHPSYLKGLDLKDRGSRPAQQIVPEIPSPK